MLLHRAEILFNKVKESKHLSKSRKQRLHFLSFKSAERNTSPTHSAWLTPRKDLGHSHQALVVNKTGHWLYYRFPLKGKKKWSQLANLQMQWASEANFRTFTNSIVWTIVQSHEFLSSHKPRHFQHFSASIVTLSAFAQSKEYKRLYL